MQLWCWATKVPQWMHCTCSTYVVLLGQHGFSLKAVPDMPTTFVMLLNMAWRICILLGFAFYESLPSYLYVIFLHGLQCFTLVLTCLNPFTIEDIYLHNSAAGTASTSAAGTAVRDVRLSDFGACAAVDLTELRRWFGDDRNLGFIEAKGGWWWWWWWWWWNTGKLRLLSPASQGILFLR